MANSQITKESNSEDYFNKLTGDLCLGLSQLISNEEEIKDVLITGDKSATSIMLFLERKCNLKTFKDNKYLI